MIASAAAADLLDAGAGADDHRAAALVVGLARAGAAEDQRAGREVGRGDVLHQVGDREVGVLDQRQRRVDHLAEVVRRDVGGHADGDAAGAVDQHVGEARRQDRRLHVLAVVVRLEVDRLLVDVGEEVGGRLGDAHLGVAHRRRLVAVHRAEVALAVEQRQRHREGLRHAHQRVVDRAVAVRVVLAHDVADRSAPTCGRPCRGCCRSRAWRRGCAGAPASARRAGRGSPG